jgi:hypothetical protein
MANQTPTGTVPPPSNLLESLKQGRTFQGFQYKPGLFVDNATYGRVRTTVCYADRREEKLDQMRQYYAQNKDFMSHQEATYMQQEMGKLQNSINPNQQVASSGPTAAQQAFDQEQAENRADIKKMLDDPIYGALRGMGVSKKTAGNVSVLVKALKGARDFKTKPEDLKEKIGNKPPFKLPPYQ